MKNLITIILLFVTSLSFSQTIQGIKIKKKPAGIFVNGVFIGNESVIN